MALAVWWELALLAVLLVALGSVSVAASRAQDLELRILSDQASDHAVRIIRGVAFALGGVSLFAMFNLIELLLLRKPGVRLSLVLSQLGGNIALLVDDDSVWLPEAQPYRSRFLTSARCLIILVVIPATCRGVLTAAASLRARVRLRPLANTWANSHDESHVHEGCMPSRAQDSV